MKIERTGKDYRIRQERPDEEPQKDLAVIAVMLAGLIAVLWIAGGRV